MINVLLYNRSAARSRAPQRGLVRNASATRAVAVYINECVYIYIYTHVCIYVYIHIYTLGIHMCVCIYIYIYVSRCLSNTASFCFLRASSCRRPACIRIHLHIHIHLSLYIYTYVYIMYTYTTYVYYHMLLCSARQVAPTE